MKFVFVLYFLIKIYKGYSQYCIKKKKLVFEKMKNSLKVQDVTLSALKKK